jgi:hypothetical protein
MIFITLAAFLFALPMKETYKPIILNNRAKKSGITPVENGPASGKLKNAIITRLSRPFHMLFTEVRQSFNEHAGGLTSEACSVLLLDIHILRLRCLVPPFRRNSFHLPAPAILFYRVSSRPSLYLSRYRCSFRSYHLHSC